MINGFIINLLIKMQDNYVSLNPLNVPREEKAIRANMYKQRVIDAQGGEANPIFGLQCGMTAGVLTYSMLANSPAGFKLYPFTAGKAQGYAKIVGSFFFFAFLGRGIVSKLFGDERQVWYLWYNKSAIMKGTKPWDKED
jgi:hypothetical protein